MLILATGATVKVGRCFLGLRLADAGWPDASARALRRNLLIEAADRSEAPRGTVADTRARDPR
jgi:hypothetical protein